MESVTLKTLSGVFTNITASSVIKDNINLPSVLPSIYKGQSEVIRRKDSGSSSQWCHNITMCAHIHEPRSGALPLP